MVDRILALLSNSFLAEGLWEMLRALAVPHARSIRIVLLAAGPIDYIVNNNLIEL